MKNTSVPGIDYLLNRWAIKSMLKILTALVFVSVAEGCKSKSPTALFSQISSTTSGIHFENTITETEEINLLRNEYTYMGGGVGVGDFNNDGLQDLFFTANQKSSGLYINEGSFRFRDVTAAAGLKTTQWCTGVSIVDINNDGWQDIYLSVSGPVAPEQRRNLLYINDGKLHFTEMAQAYGLDDKSHSTQAAFLDYDKDGLLDMFLLTHEMGGTSINKVVPKDLSGTSPRNDQLYHNEGISAATGHPHFKNVTGQAGIRDDGFGLGVVVSDLNGDNWPDLYVTNDYIANDCMWLNNKDGSFTNVISKSLNHQSYSSMGVDAADINNDGLPDIATLDMMPEDNERKKMMYSILSNERHEMEKYLQYEPSYMHNTLQLNRGLASVNDTTVPVFSDIANFAGTAETDWSWSLLAADFDNDGAKDMHITNGMGKDMINSDFVKFRSSAPAGPDRDKLTREQLEKFGPVKLSNYLFRNNHNYSFTNISDSAGMAEKSISNGAAYADLDNDGDLDMVVNNINQEAFLFSNNTIQNNRDSAHFLSIQLKGPDRNKDGLGTIVKIYQRDSMILLEQNPVRGYLSTVDKRLFTGLHHRAAVDSIQVLWPDDSMQVLRGLTTNQLLTIDYRNRNAAWQAPALQPALFENLTNSTNINFTHTDPFFFDYDFQRLLPQKFSSLGPGIAVGDVNKDGLQDFFIGNGYHVKGMVFTQNRGGSFSSKALEEGEKFEEDTGCLFFDADGDGDEDLVVTSGTNEFAANSPYYLPRLYVNDGKGNFSRSSNTMPDHLTTVTSVVKASDFDGDGDQDLFLGGRILSAKFPAPASSYLLQNNRGFFTDVTQSLCPALSGIGMVTDAEWMDADGDKKPDLVIAGEWMPIRVFKNNTSAFTENNNSGLTPFTGMWRSLHAADLDRDGDPDFVAGNIGLNNKFHFNATYPLHMWYADLDDNGFHDPVMGYYMHSPSGSRELYPALGLDDIAGQVPAIKKSYLTHKDFANATMSDLFKSFEGTSKLTAKEGSSCWFENDGTGAFRPHQLPFEAQFAPVNCILVKDYNGDGFPDILLAGNEYQAEVMTGRYDAGYGLLLLGSKRKEFDALPHYRSGIFLRGDTRCMRPIMINGRETVLAAVNNSRLEVFGTAKP